MNEWVAPALVAAAFAFLLYVGESPVKPDLAVIEVEDEGVYLPPPPYDCPGGGTISWAEAMCSRDPVVCCPAISIRAPECSNELPPGWWIAVGSASYWLRGQPDNWWDATWEHLDDGGTFGVFATWRACAEEGVVTLKAMGRQNEWIKVPEWRKSHAYPRADEDRACIPYGKSASWCGDKSGFAWTKDGPPKWLNEDDPPWLVDPFKN